MILATNNKGKLREIREILEGYKLESLSEAGITVDVEEDQGTFYGNVLKKAREIHDMTGEDVIADDSGLCINAYQGWPGVLTHRFAGEDVTDEVRNNIILDKMKGISDRSANVVCNLVYYDGNVTLLGKGILEGKISEERRGSNGFGFDDIFELANGKTLAELTSEEKNEISARRLATEDLKLQLLKKKR